jgi:hypothetical protein
MAMWGLYLPIVSQDPLSNSKISSISHNLQWLSYFVTFLIAHITFKTMRNTYIMATVRESRPQEIHQTFKPMKFGQWNLLAALPFPAATSRLKQMPLPIP